MTTLRALGLLLCGLFLMLVATPAAAQDETAETQRLQRECRDGRGPSEACVTFGFRLFKGLGTAKDDATALRVWRAACEKDNRDACHNVGVVLRWSEQAPQDHPAALTYYERACRMGYAESCLDLGYMRQGGIGTAVDAEMARQGFSLACAGNVGDGCQQQGYMYLNGWGIASHDGNALNSFRAGCAINDWESCGMVGFMAYNGRGMAPDMPLAIRQYQAACAHEQAFACSNLEEIRTGGPGMLGYEDLITAEAVTRMLPADLPPEQQYLIASGAYANGDTALAIAAFEQLAQAGLADAAFSLGQIYYNGQGVPADRARGLRYIDRAASAGHPYAKFIIANFYYYGGDGIAVNEIWGIQMMRSAAETGGIAEAGPIWQSWQNRMNARYEARDAAMRAMAEENERSAAAADAANMARIWGLYSSSQNQQGNGQVCGMVYRNNQANQECMARETYDRYYNPAYQ